MWYALFIKKGRPKDPAYIGPFKTIKEANEWALHRELTPCQLVSEPLDKDTPVFDPF
jgi:hypothetical protein